MHSLSRPWLLIFCVLCIVALGGLSGLSTVSGLRDWYVHLHKPFFNPPNSVFGPVWTVLYVFMGFTLYRLIILPASGERTLVIFFFIIQLILNLAWSVIFFYLQKPGWALIEIITLWGFILLMIRKSILLDKLAGYIQIPYLLWVSFATLLNAALWWLNR